MPAAPISDTELASLRRDMLRFARMQLRDDAAAEDVVQEALIAAVEKHASRTGEASLRTWVFAILKNRIIDLLRARQRRLQYEVEVTDATTDAMFDEAGHWREETTPADWGDPEAALNSRQFWIILEACLYRLQEAAARVFMMREMLGFDTDEICTTLDIKPNHCGVLLHRARLGLRACLEQQWLAAGSN